MLSKIPILAALFFISSDSYCQKNKRSKTAPYGTVRVNDTLYVDKTEVANVHWREYLHYLLDVKKDTIAYKKALPDTLVWLEDSLASYYINYYFRHPGNGNYPVVGISYEQAVKFCKWRTYAANQGDYFRKNKISDFRNHLNDSFPIRYYYRLPSKDEWEMAAKGNIDTSISQYGGVEIRFPNRCCYFNTKGYFDHINKGRSEPDRLPEFRLFATTFLFSNKYGVYAYIGNVAELISEKGVAKGGSFIHTLEECKIVNNQHYSQPERWLGFRCVAVVVK